MKKIEHTPAKGPYKVGEDDELHGCPFIPIIGADGGTIAEVVSDYSEDRPNLGGRERATARLLATAPDLLETVKTFVAMIEDSMSGSFHRDVGPFIAGVTDLELRPDGTFKLSDARSIIAKAEGR